MSAPRSNRFFDSTRGPQQVTVEAQNLVNDRLLRQFILYMPDRADRVARKHADRMVEVAKFLAPKSALTGSNSQGTTPMSESIYRKGANARYTIIVDHPAAAYVLFGTRPHVIKAGALGATGTVNRTGRVLKRLRRQRDVFAAAAEPASKRFNPRTGNPRSKLSAREQATHAVAVRTVRGLNQKIRAISKTRQRALHAKGKQMLAFPWAGRRARAAGIRALTLGHTKQVESLKGGWFVGPIVHHPGTRANNFMLRARSRVAPGFARDLKALLEGR